MPRSIETLTGKDANIFGNCFGTMKLNDPIVLFLGTQKKGAARGTGIKIEECISKESA